MVPPTVNMEESQVIVPDVPNIQSTEDEKECPDPSDGRINDTGDYMVEKILDTCLDCNGSKKTRMYLVKWYLWPELSLKSNAVGEVKANKGLRAFLLKKYNTWEPESNLLPGSNLAIQEFWNRKKNAENEAMRKKMQDALKKVNKSAEISSLAVNASSSFSTSLPGSGSLKNRKRSGTDAELKLEVAKDTNTTCKKRNIQSEPLESPPLSPRLEDSRKEPSINIDNLIGKMTVLTEVPPSSQLEKIYGSTTRVQPGRVTFLVKWKHENSIALVDADLMYEAHQNAIEEWLENEKNGKNGSAVEYTA